MVQIIIGSIIGASLVLAVRSYFRSPRHQHNKYRRQVELLRAELEGLNTLSYSFDPCMGEFCRRAWHELTGADFAINRNDFSLAENHMEKAKEDLSNARSFMTNGQTTT